MQTLYNGYAVPIINRIGINTTRGAPSQIQKIFVFQIPRPAPVELPAPGAKKCRNVPFAPAHVALPINIILIIIKMIFTPCPRRVTYQNHFDNCQNDIHPLPT